MSNLGGPAETRELIIDVRLEMEAFDRLPLALRECLRYAEGDYSALGLIGYVSCYPAAVIVREIRNQDVVNHQKLVDAGLAVPRCAAAPRTSFASPTASG